MKINLNLNLTVTYILLLVMMNEIKETFLGKSEAKLIVGCMFTLGKGFKYDKTGQ